MKKHWLTTILAIVTLFFPLILLAQNQALQTYTLDPAHSYVEWHISHFGFSNPSGKWFVNGTLLLDEHHPQRSKVNVTINVADMVTGIPKLDEHLKDKDFFDVVEYPTATFVSNKVQLTGQYTANVHGTLTLRGVAKPVTLDVTLNKKGMSVINKKETVGFTATTVLKRSDFGMKAYLPGLGDEVRINIESEATLAS